MLRQHESLLDPVDLDYIWEYAELRTLLKSVQNQIVIDPKPFHDCIGQPLQECDVVLYSDKDWGPLPGWIVKIEDDGEFCAVSYSGNPDDCKNMNGEIVCKDLVYKCLKIDKTILKMIYKIENETSE